MSRALTRWLVERVMVRLGYPRERAARVGGAAWRRADTRAEADEMNAISVQHHVNLQRPWRHE